MMRICKFNQEYLKQRPGRRIAQYLLPEDGRDDEIYFILDDHLVFVGAVGIIHSAYCDCGLMPVIPPDLHLAAVIWKRHLTAGLGIVDYLNAMFEMTE